jgi:DNA repair exonuclease SbcCD nuclease subunit
MNLFENVMVFTDLHVGLKHNSKEHLEDCVDFIKWFINEAKSRNAETCICMGDFHHHRSNINILSLNYSIDILRLLNSAFKKTYMLVGNHDMFFRENRNIHSMVIGEEFANIEMIDNIVVKDNVLLIPWLVEDEWRTISSLSSKYTFGHLELPGFKMNAMIEMPDNGALNTGHFTTQDYVFSGHFHKRQNKGRINYIGNPFGHNYSDSWDFDRGAMFLNWDNEPEYINYRNGPRFIDISLSSLLQNPDLYLTPSTHLQVNIDVNITYEEASFLRETFISQYNVREFKLISNINDHSVLGTNDNSSLKTVDAIVIDQLQTNITSNTYDIAKLIEIYNGL